MIVLVVWMTKYPFKVIMDNMIREYAKNNSVSFTQTFGVDEEKTVYQFDQVSLARFVNQVQQRFAEFTPIAYS